jgi:hypothetical protein
MALNYVKGIISQFGQVESGTTQNGNSWSRQVVVLDVAGFGNSFSKIALTAQNQRVEELQNYQIGDRVEVGYSVTAREWNGKWFNNVDLVNINFMEEFAPAAPAAPAPQVAPVAPAPRQAAPRQVARPARTTPLVPPGANLEPQDDDLPC